MREVFILRHSHVLEKGDEDLKLIGVYSSHEEAEKAKARAIKLPGFFEYPDGFAISRHVLDKNDCVNVSSFVLK